MWLWAVNEIDDNETNEKIINMLTTYNRFQGWNQNDYSKMMLLLFFPHLLSSLLSGSYVTTIDR